jgi:hypothetical protein
VSAVRALAEAKAAGVEVVAKGGRLHLRALAEPSRELLARLHAYKPELLAILSGDRCRFCGELMRWPAAVGIILADSTALHHGCAELFEVERLKRPTADAFTSGTLPEKAEPMAGDEPLP